MTWEIVCPTPDHEQVALSRKTNMFPMSPEIANLGSSVGTLMLICNSQLIFRGLKCLHIKAQTALSLLGDVISLQRGIFWKMWRIAHRQWDQGIQEILFYLSQAKESLSFTSSSCCGWGENTAHTPIIKKFECIWNPYRGSPVWLIPAHRTGNTLEVRAEDQNQGLMHPTLSLLPEQFLQPLFAFRVPKIQHAAIFESPCFIAQKLESDMLLSDWGCVFPFLL